LLFELLDGLKEYPAGQIVFSGFSQGCLMSIEVGARYPRQLAGIVGISGFVHEPEKLIRELSPVARKQRFLLTHGTEDTLLPIQGTRKQVELLKKAGLNIEWREFAKAHNVAGAAEIAVIRQFVRECYGEPAKTERCDVPPHNPKGIESFSPGLRGTSYPGENGAKITTL
jgi:phospholipase/carboxylesterase